MENNAAQTLPVSNEEQTWLSVPTDFPNSIVANVLLPIVDDYHANGTMNTASTVASLTVILLSSKDVYDSLLTNLCQSAVNYVTQPFRAEEWSVKLHDLLAHPPRWHGNQWQAAVSPKPVETVQESWLRKVYKLLETHLDDPSLNVEWLAGQLAMSRKTLLRKIQTLTQLSPNELIRQYRLRKASDLLRAGHSVSETAYLVGFETPAYFGQCFKEYYQITPSEFAHSAN